MTQPKSIQDDFFDYIQKFSAKKPGVAPLNLIQPSPTKQTIKVHTPVTKVVVAPAPLVQSAPPSTIMQSVVTAATPTEIRALIESFVGTKTLLIDPDGAQELLKGNINRGRGRTNRAVSVARVQKMAEDMRQSRFILTGEPIIMNTAGYLNTGQHRLYAVIMSGVPTMMDVRFGITPEAFTVTDTGKPQTARDVLYRNNVRDASHVSPAIRLVLAYRAGLPDNGNRITGNDVVAEGVREFPDIVDAVELVSSLRWPPRVRTAPIDALAFFAIRSAGLPIATKFLSDLASGAGLEHTDPVFMLRERLISDPNRKLKIIDKLAIGIKAWNAWRGFGSISAAKNVGLRWQGRGATAEAFPTVAGLVL
jgi:hypothetical protein